MHVCNNFEQVKALSSKAEQKAYPRCRECGMYKSCCAGRHTLVGRCCVVCGQYSDKV